MRRKGLFQSPPTVSQLLEWPWVFSVPHIIQSSWWQPSLSPFFCSSLLSRGHHSFTDQPWQRRPLQRATPGHPKGHGWAPCSPPQPPGCHHCPVCHAAISATERNGSSQGKALAEGINERFWVFLENCSITGMIWNIYQRGELFQFADFSHYLTFLLLFYFSLLQGYQAGLWGIQQWCLQS